MELMLRSFLLDKPKKVKSIQKEVEAIEQDESKFIVLTNTEHKYFMIFFIIIIHLLA